MGRANLNWIFI